MYIFEPLREPMAAAANLDRLVKSAINPKKFKNYLSLLHDRFTIYTNTCPTPLIAPNLIVTPEIRRQSELYLPIAEITAIFNSLYHCALTYQPILSSTPFHRALSWADVLVALPPGFQQSANPALLLEALLSERELLIRFLFASFLPRRFYDGFGRYPRQMDFIRERLDTISHFRRGNGPIRLRCLDAACGTGEDSYSLARLLMQRGLAADEFRVEGWTLEPLEIWAAAHNRFPHDRRRESEFRRETAPLFEQGCQSVISFRCADLTENPPNLIPKNDTAKESCRFDLILCNGLLGGPIISEAGLLLQVVTNLEELLEPGGLLLAADSFHDGWNSRVGKSGLKELFLQKRLTCFDAGEGIGGLKF